MKNEILYRLYGNYIAGKVISGIGMSFPIRCFTCGKLIGHLYEKYVALTSEGEDLHQKVLDDMKIYKFCCRRMFMTHVDIDEYRLAYPTYPDRIHRLYEKNSHLSDINDTEVDVADVEDEVEEVEY
jgi:DNA-directed RNA polymerase subunit N